MTALNKNLQFVPNWYEQLIENGNEKIELAHFIRDYAVQANIKKLLEIGMGTKPIFSEILADFVDKYTIVEKEIVPNIRLASNVTLIQKDFENVFIDSKFDLIILSHVIYYFSDISKTINKAMHLLNQNGKAIFVVNGMQNDYGRIKHAFADISRIKFTFTYERLHEVLQLQNLDFEEYTIQTSIQFDSYQDLYERLRLFFDLFPKEYSSNRISITDWLRKNIKKPQFCMDQKIIVVGNSCGS